MLRGIATLTLAILFTGVLHGSAAAQENDTPGTAPLGDAIARAAKTSEAPVTLWTLSQTPKPLRRARSRRRAAPFQACRSPEQRPNRGVLR